MEYFYKFIIGGLVTMFCPLVIFYGIYKVGDKILGYRK